MGGFRKDGSVDLRFLPRIRTRRLGRENAHGLSLQLFDHDVATKERVKEPSIELDAWLSGRHKLEVVIHESLHLAYPALSEIVIRKGARYVAMIVWHLGYRHPEEMD